MGRGRDQSRAYILTGPYPHTRWEHPSRLQWVKVHLGGMEVEVSAEQGQVRKKAQA